MKGVEEEEGGEEAGIARMMEIDNSNDKHRHSRNSNDHNN